MGSNAVHGQETAPPVRTAQAPVNLESNQGGGEDLTGAGAGLRNLDAYWREQATLPTGRGDPAWLRQAAQRL